ncbi:unnamed protein product [Umbelopsis ramanniana]
MAQQAKQAAQRLGGMFPKGSGKGIGGAAGAIITLGALGYGINASLFNVDGGHRAIKYTRLFGVQNKSTMKELISSFPGSKPPLSTMSEPNLAMLRL